MDATLALTWDGTLQALGLLAALLFVVGGTTIWIRQRVLGYWLAAWGSLLLTGALLLAQEAGAGQVAFAAYVTAALVAPLLLMGSLEVADRPALLGWPLFLGLGVGLLRGVLDAGDAAVSELMLRVTVAPALLVFAAETLRRAPGGLELRRSIAVLLVGFAGIEIYDAVIDFQTGDNGIVWRGMFAICLPLAALQITACILRIGDEIASARAAKGAIQAERDVANWRLDHVFGNVHDLIAEIGDDTRILYVNDRVQDVLGYAPDELVGRYAIDFVPEPQRAFAAETFRDRIKRGLPQGTHSIELEAKSGTTRSLEFSMSSYGDAETMRWIVVVRDVTERLAHERALVAHQHRLESRVEERTEALAASQERLRAQERLAAVGTLASGIAHQINNPVGAISAAAEYALGAGDGEEADAVRRDSLRRIVEESARAGRIVRDILRFARHGETTKWPEDLGAVVRRSVEASRDYVAERGGRIEMDVASVGLPVALSPIEIEQMMVNLIFNAAESNDEGAEIVVSLSRVADRAVVAVADDGRGMSAETRAHAFDPFFTSRLRDGGSGLGLAIVHRIVEDHGGTIDIASAPGAGTTIRIAFPIVDPAEIA